jgi:hypothetical protein
MLSAKLLGIALITGVVSGCASVTAVPLNIDGTKKKDGKDQDLVAGIRYYMPKPYLLITELPVAPTPPANSGNNNNGGGGGRGGAGGAHGADAAAGDQTQGQSTNTGNGNSPTASPPAAGATDTSFAASMVSYNVKLVYLPDYASPMALTMNTGLFGTVSAGPALQDGWMLTGVSQSADSGVANTLTAVASIASALTGGGAGAGGGTKGGGGGLPAEAATQSSDAATQMLKSLPSTIPGFTEQQTGTLKSLLQRLATVQPSAGSASQTTWGPNVLQPGLYEFRYDTAGTLFGLVPIMVFCNDGARFSTFTPATAGQPAGITYPKCGTGRTS